MIEENNKNIAVAWYRENQWDKLLEFAIDSGKLEKTYEEWVSQAKQHIEELKNKGFNPARIDVEVNALKSWCEKEGRAVDGPARVEYTIIAAQENKNILQ